MRSTQTTIGLGLAALLACGAGLPAEAQDAVPALPSLALNPPPPPTVDPQTPSVWSGLSVGSDVFAVTGGGAKGRVGGGGFVSYQREFPNHFVIGLEGEAGYAPAWFARGPFKGYDYGATDMKLGYDMGPVMPFVTTGVALAKPTARTGALDAGDAVNDLLAPTANVKVGGSVGVGVDVKITPGLMVTMGVGMERGPPTLFGR